MAEKRSGELTITIRYVKLGPKVVIAATTIGGFTLRGERADTPFDAVRSLLNGLGGSPAVSSHVDSAIALDLALAGVSIDDVTAATAAPTSDPDAARLGAGDADDDAGDADDDAGDELESE